MTRLPQVGDVWIARDEANAKLPDDFPRRIRIVGKLDGYSDGRHEVVVADYHSRSLDLVAATPESVAELFRFDHVETVPVGALVSEDERTRIDRERAESINQSDLLNALLAGPHI